MTQHAGIGFLQSIIVDVADFERAEVFWSRLLGCEFGQSVQPTFRRAHLASGFDFVLQRSDEPKTGKNRVHFDFDVDEPEAAVALIVELGGQALRTIDNGQGGFTVCADPDGNEFCIGPPSTHAPPAGA